MFSLIKKSCNKIQMFNIHTHIHIYIYIYIYIYQIRWPVSVCVYIYIYIYTYTHRPPYLIHLFNCLVTQIANQPITWQQLRAFRLLDVVKTTSWSSKKGDLSDFECGMVVGARRSGVSMYTYLFIYIYTYLFIYIYIYIYTHIHTIRYSFKALSRATAFRIWCWTDFC